MREIIFRGKRIDSGEWVYGLFARAKIGSLICPCIQKERESDAGDFVENIEIDGNILSQFTGLRDSKRTAEFPEGQRIFEGDICSFMLEGVKRIECVHFGDGSFVLGSCISLHQSQLDYYREVRKSLLVIGNIHEHRNLLCGD